MSQVIKNSGGSPSPGTVVQTLSDDVGTIVNPSASNNIQLVGHVFENGGLSKFSTVVAGTNLENINPMSSSRWIVDPLGFNGTHTTISAALASAFSGDTIFLLPGTYTENPTLKAGVNITAYPCDGFAGGNNYPNVIILGNVTANYSGSCSISGVMFETNGAYCITVSGSNNTYLDCVDCYVYASNNNAISFTSSGNSKLELRQCKGNIATNGITYFTHSGAGAIKVFQCVLENDEGPSTTPSTVTGSGVFNAWNSYWACPITTSGTSGFNASNTQFIGSLIIGGTATNTLFECDIEATGVSSAISVSVGAVLQLGNCTIATSNTNAITGLGEIVYGGLVFTSTSSLINTTTQLPKVRSNDAVQITVPGAYPYTVKPQDAVIIVDTTGSAVTINLNASPVNGQMYRIKDVKGNAGTNNITVTPASGNIDGAASYIMNQNYQSIDVVYSGSQWSVL